MNEPTHATARAPTGRVPTRSPIRALMMLPGLGLVALGIVIVIWPQVLVWMVAGTFIVLGLVLLVVARKLHRARQRLDVYASAFRDAR